MISQRDRQSSSPQVSRLAVIVAICAALLSAGQVLARPAADLPESWVKGELLVGFRGGVGEIDRQRFYERQGADHLADIGQTLRVARIRVPANLEDAVIARLSQNPAVKFIEKNYEFTPALLPDDPEYLGQWSLPVINAPEAWDLSLGGPAAIIAIVDSGVDPAQPDFAGKLIAGYNTYSHNTDTSDPYGHGTQVAGIAAALTNNTVGIAGIAGKAPIMPVRVTNNTGVASAASIAEGIIWAADHGARVINVSFDAVAANATILAAAEYAYHRGALVVAASGNCSCADSTVETPFILSVSATDETDHLAGFSTIGPFVDVSAPGANILTTAQFGLYISESGTSLASPAVAGIAGLMFDAMPTLTPLLATEMIEASAIDVNNNGYDVSYGYGRVDAHGAVKLAVNYLPPPDSTAPSVAVLSPGSSETLSGTAVVEVAAEDDSGVVRVDLYVDTKLFASDSVSPYSFAWDTTKVANGSHVLAVYAIDAAGNSRMTAPLSLRVNNIPPDTTAPRVTITTPTAGGRVARNVIVVVDAADDTAVKSVALHVDGVMIADTAAAPYSFNWNSSLVADGVHTLEVSAADAAGNIGYASQTVTVNNSMDGTPVAAADSFSAPYRSSAPYASLVLPVLANDTDADGDIEVGSVRITSRPSNGGTARAQRDGTVTYIPARRTSGAETFTYTVRDSRRHVSNTATVTVTISAPPPGNGHFN